VLLALVAFACDDEGKPAIGGPAPDGGVTDSGPADGGADADPRVAARALVTGVAEMGSLRIPGLSAEVHVLRTEGDIPHIYAANRLDLARVQGYLVARDRFFMMDLGRRLAQGRLSELVGDVVLDVDITARNQGMRHAGERIAASLPAELAAEFDAFAAGINTYIDHVEAGRADPPSELEIAFRLLGAASPAELMAPFTRGDLAAFAATVLYLSGFEPIDLEVEVGIEAALAGFAGAPFADLRRAGIVRDVFERVTPVFPVASIEGGARAEPATAGGGSSKGARRPLPATARGLVGQLRLMQGLLGKSSRKEFGSNAWAVAGDRTADGATLIEGDGHLTMSVPTFFVQMGIDTDLFGEDESPHIRGLFIPGLPMLGVGTNGHVAWSFTYFNADVTDWYREELRIGADGFPDASRFRGEWRPLRGVDETYTLRGVPALQSEGGDVVVRRWETFDGRRIMAVEGLPVGEGVEPGPDDAVINLGGGRVIVGDLDRDGVVSAVSMDYTGLDVGGAIPAYDGLARTRNVAEFRDMQRRVGVFGSHFAVGDAAGDILITGYHASPCRAHLPRGADGRFEAGANPARVLDGTRFGGFTVGFTEDGQVDESSRGEVDCVVPFDDFPAETSPERGFVMTANNDPSGLGFDDNVANDPVYIGTGNWALGFRASEIHGALQATVEAGDADIEKMREIQGIQVSVTGRRYAPLLVAAIERARGLGAPGDDDEARLAALHSEEADDVAERLLAWGTRGYRPRSGVATFYNAPTADDREDAVATMIFNAWLGHFAVALLADEGVPDGGDSALALRRKMRTLDLALYGRGPDNPLGLASWNPDTEESVFFDLVGTPEVEGSDELILIALADALAFLRSPPLVGGGGGFGTDEMSEWRWGLRHLLVLDSLLGPFLPESAGAIGALLQQFGITPTDLPLAEGLPRDDPRRRLPGFPRSGDNYNVDNGDPGLSGTEFTFSHGPVMRMVIALRDGEVRGTNIIPGGQSGLKGSEHRADQLARWLGNEVWPLRYHVEEVVEGAVGRELYRP